MMGLRSKFKKEEPHQHQPVDWFTPGVYPSCSCGFTPHDNRLLNEHWAEHGLRWRDVNGALRSERVP